MRNLILITCTLLVAGTTYAQNVVEPEGPAEWSAPYEPFRIVGNVYWVGTYDLACYLITDKEGHILINTGLAASADVIKKNVESLGFKMADIKILLTTQAHHDHVGAMATIRKMTGARLLVNEKDAAVMEDGGMSDYAFGGKTIFEPVKVDGLLHDGDSIRIGRTRLVMLNHPGHTKGSCSFLLNVESYRVLIVNMPSIVIAQKFAEVKSYPGIEEDYRRTIAALKGLKFDIWLSSHASQFNMHAKRKPGDKYNPTAFKDQKGFGEAIRNLEAAFERKVAEEENR